MLRKQMLGEAPELEISADEYEEISRAKGTLTAAHALESTYEITASNFLELEKELLSIAVSNMVRVEFGYAEAAEVQSRLGTRVVNLLTAARLYIDQLPQHVTRCLPGSPEVRGTIESLCNRHYDLSFDYRFMEAFRNHVLHRGAPLHLVTTGSQWTSLDENGVMEFYVEMSVRRDYLADDPKFKKTVLAEMPSSVDLQESCRGYVEAISSIHEEVRTMSDAAVLSARGVLSTAIERFQAACATSDVGIDALALEDGVPFETVHLVLDWDDVRMALRRRNRSMANLRKRVATSKRTRTRR